MIEGIDGRDANQQHAAGLAREAFIGEDAVALLDFIGRATLGLPLFDEVVAR